MFNNSKNLERELLLYELKKFLEYSPNLKKELFCAYQEFKENQIDIKSLLIKAQSLIKKTNLNNHQIKNFLLDIQAKNTNILTIHTPSQLPEPSQIQEIREPWIRAEIILPEEMLGKVIELVTSRRGSYSDVSLLSKGQLQLIAQLPLAEMIIDFYDELKSLTKGYGTLSYEITHYQSSELVKVDILVNRQKVDPLSFITHKSYSESKAREVCAKLKDLIPRQQIEIIIQASIGARIIARETIKPFRKDVTAKLYGGDITRRKKLLEKQKAGKKRMKMVGNVEIPQAAFLNILKK